MSFDRQLNQVCPHYVVEEARFLSNDRITVRPARPIASVTSVRVRVDSLIEVPSFGYHIPAKVAGSKVGPFTIRSGINDRLVLSVDGQPLQTLMLPSGSKVSSRQIAESLNLSAQGVSFSVTASNRISLESRTVGKGSTLVLDPTSTLAASLGLGVSRVWRGKTVFPGWSLIKDPNTLNDRPAKLVVFDVPLLGFREFVELNYATVRQECRRCGGLGVENDWTYTTSGDLLTVRDENLLIQEFQKICYTVQGSNPFHAWYGTSIIDSIGRKLSNSGIVQNFIVSDIYEAFRRWQAIKRQQEEVVGQMVTDGEYPFKLLEVHLEQSQEDPTIVFVTASLQSRSFREPILIERALRLPQPLDILGSTTQEALLKQSLPNYRLTG